MFVQTLAKIRQAADKLSQQVEDISSMGFVLKRLLLLSAPISKKCVPQQRMSRTIRILNSLIMTCPVLRMISCSEKPLSRYCSFEAVAY
jgi:hypothetical protein